MCLAWRYELRVFVFQNFLRSLPHSNSQNSPTEQQPGLCTSVSQIESTNIVVTCEGSPTVCTTSAGVCTDDKPMYSSALRMCSDSSTGMCDVTSAGCRDMAATCNVSVVNCSDSIVSCADSTVSGTDSVVDCCSSKTEASSIGPESAICDDSVPSTPEVQTDNQPPKFLPSSSPTLSQDSGTVSLDSGMEGCKRVSSPTASDNSTLVPDESPPSRSDSVEEARTEITEYDTVSDVHKQHSCPSGEMGNEMKHVMEKANTKVIQPLLESVSHSADGSTIECTAKEDLAS